MTNSSGVGLGDGLLADLRPVPHHHHTVGDAENLVEAVGDVDHAHPARFQPADGREEPLHLVGGQACGRLVQHQEVALHHQRAGNGDKRLLRAAEALHPRRGVDVAADQREGICGTLLGAPPVDGAEQPGTGGEAFGEAHILGHRHPFDEAEVLMDEGDAVRARRLHTMAIDRAADRDDTFVGADDAAKHLDERGFAGAILAEECDDIAPRNLEAHALQRARAAE